MVSRNSAFALTVMLLVSSSAQAMSYVPSMPSLPSLSSLFSVFNKDNGAFVAKVAASLAVIKVACVTGSTLTQLGAKYTPACVASAYNKATSTAYSLVPARFKSAPVVAAPVVCLVNARLTALENYTIDLASRTTTLEAQTAAFSGTLAELRALQPSAPLVSASAAAPVASGN